MFRTLIEIVNWILAIAMWLLIGRAVLDWLFGERPTVIGRLFRLVTDPLHRPARRLFPRLSSPALSLFLALLLFAARVTLVLAYAALV
ncbi:MAG: YggT family protein [Thermomicrobium sp.]|nr:YggT family protein [Thermomicrobium sp.]